jgi:hypothetical protein
MSITNLVSMNNFLVSAKSNEYILDNTNLSPNTGNPSLKVGPSGTGEVDCPNPATGWMWNCNPGDTIDMSALIKTGLFSGGDSMPGARINVDFLANVPGVSGTVIPTLDASGNQASSLVQNYSYISNGGLLVPPNTTWALSHNKFTVPNNDIYFVTVGITAAINAMLGDPVTIWYDSTGKANVGVYQLSTPIKISGFIWSFWNSDVAYGMTAWFVDPELYINNLRNSLLYRILPRN